MEVKTKTTAWGDWKREVFLDGIEQKRKTSITFDLPLVRFARKYKHSSVLFSKYGRTESFFTQDSKLYLTPQEVKGLRRKERIVRLIGRLDSLQARSFEKTRIYTTKKGHSFDLNVQEKYEKFRESALQLAENATGKITLAKMWNLSIVGSVIFGMFLMTMIYRYLGQNVSAQINSQLSEQNQIAAVAEDEIKTEEVSNNIDTQTITKLIEDYGSYGNAEFESKIREMVKGYPIEKMVPQIAKKDRIVAAFIIGIARQESTWGVHVPLYQGKDCYNYWGWRGKNAVGTGGHTCFSSPEEAVDTVAKRIAFLVSNQKLDTPEKMIVWKCGDCSWDTQKNMQIWINSVSTYFKKLNKDE